MSDFWILLAMFAWHVCLGFFTCCCEEGCEVYRLTNCSNGSDHLYTETDLSAFLGKALRVNGSSTCRTVNCGSGGTPAAATINAAFNNCAACTTPATCADCCSGDMSAMEFGVDLGAGGWTNAACDACDQVAGEFFLQHAGGCTWEYEDENFCTVNNICGFTVARPATLTIRVSIGVDELSRCVMSVSVRMVASAENPCANEALWATGVSGGQIVPPILDCSLTGPWTLSGLSTAGAVFCGGALPSTIGVRRAA